MRLELARLHKELNATIVYVTHDQVEAMTLADKVVVLNQGIIEQVGTPMELYNKPRNEFVAGFIGTPKMSFIKGKVGDKADTISLQTGGVLAMPKNSGLDLTPQETTTIGIRPEHISIVAKDEGTIAGKLQASEHLGSDTYCYVRLTEGELVTIRQPANFEATYGQTIGIKIDTRYCHYFNKEGRSCRVD